MRNACRTGLPLAAVMLLLLSGCASGPPAVVPEPEPVAALPEPPPPPLVEPEPEPPPPPVVEVPRAEIALVVDTSTPAHAAVADEIALALPPRRYRVARFTTDAAPELEALRDRRVTIVAVGPGAVRAARAALPNKPLVFCQVQAHDEALQSGTPIFGVQTLPPLALQLKSWQSVDPTLRTIALIVSASGAALAEEARRAASALAKDLLVEISASDRETLYLFRRLATTVDGLWLLPDNDALSPPVLRELLSLCAVARYWRDDVQRGAARARRPADGDGRSRGCRGDGCARRRARRRGPHGRARIDDAAIGRGVRRQRRDRRDARPAAGRGPALGGP